MVTIEASLLSRVKLTYLLMGLSGTQEELDIWDSVCEAVKLSAAEAALIGLEEQKNSSGEIVGAAWQPRNEHLNDKIEISLETEHARRLLTFLRTFQGFQRVDREWAKEMTQALKMKLP